MQPSLSSSIAAFHHLATQVLREHETRLAARQRAAGGRAQALVPDQENGRLLGRQVFENPFQDVLQQFLVVDRAVEGGVRLVEQFETLDEALLLFQGVGQGGCFTGRVVQQFDGLAQDRMGFRMTGAILFRAWLRCLLQGRTDGLDGNARLADLDDVALVQHHRAADQAAVVARTVVGLQILQ